MRKLAFVCLMVLLFAVGVTAQEEGEDTFIFGDLLPDAPELAVRGEFGVGVQTLELVDPGRVDVLSEEDPRPTYDRPLTVEVWYPAIIADDAGEMVTYEDNLGRSDNPASPVRPFTFEGRALRDAEPDASAGPYPLVIVSHGFPGSRLMMTYLTENLASKGYVVVSIGHTDSTFPAVGPFASTLLNRSLDQLFVLDEIATMSADDGESFLAGLVDAENTGLIGYSMGGYGALNAIGAGYNGLAANFGPGESLNVLVAGNDAYQELLDDRIKAAVLFAPWGGDLSGLGLGSQGLWDEPALAEIDMPTLWVVGSQDDVSMFSGVEKLFNWAVNSERKLLIYDNALHNVAPNPPPAAVENLTDYERYADPVWEETRINNINQHFVTAFLGLHLKGNEDFADYLDVPLENANDAVYAVDDAGEFTEDHTYWAGFAPRTAVGLSLIDGE